VGFDHRIDQDRIRELEHLDVDRFLGLIDGLQDRFDPVVGLHNQMMDGVCEHEPIRLGRLFCVNQGSTGRLGKTKISFPSNDSSLAG